MGLERGDVKILVTAYTIKGYDNHTNHGKDYSFFGIKHLGYHPMCFVSSPVHLSYDNADSSVARGEAYRAYPDFCAGHHLANKGISEDSQIPIKRPLN